MKMMSDQNSIFIDREHYWKDLPIPKNWDHYVSYPNDECPSFLVKNYWQVFIDHPDPSKRFGYTEPSQDAPEGWKHRKPPRFVIVPYDWGWLENSENWDHHYIFYDFDQVLKFLDDDRNMMDKFLNQRKL